MMSSGDVTELATSRQGTPPRARKRPAERRAEILHAAADIALRDGLERITLRAVAEDLGVRPGLISHYFPAAEDLVTAAFTLAVTQERRKLIVESGNPLERAAHFVRRLESGEADGLSRLWLNARHLSRFSPPLAGVIEEQEALDRDRLIALIDAGVAHGEFVVDDALAACIRIFVAVDGYGAYANNSGDFEHPAFTYFVGDALTRELGIPVDRLRAAIDQLEN